LGRPGTPLPGTALGGGALKSAPETGNGKRGLGMTERQLMAGAIVLVLLLAAMLLLWRRSRRVRRVPARHLRIDLTADPAEAPAGLKR
jgi:hypothetical protein